MLPPPPSYAGGRQATEDEITQELLDLFEIRGSRKGRGLLKRASKLWVSRRTDDRAKWRKECSKLGARVANAGLDMTMGGEGYDIRAVLEAMQGWVAS